MIYSIKLIGREQQTINKWAGGTTTQLAIYPEDGSYADRNFIWRLSSAVVELEESAFTKLPGFYRTLMVLEGELKLVHEGYHAVELKQFEQDSFNGAWNTTSYGKARDFNLMLREGINGRLKHIMVMPQHNTREALLNRDDQMQIFAYYCYRGAIEISLEEQKRILKEDELLVVHYSGNMEIVIGGLHEHESHVISAQIYI